MKVNDFRILYKKDKKQTEHDLQCECVRLFRLQYPSLALLLFAIPNGGQRDIVVAAKLKAEGALSGVPDLFFAHPSGEYHGLWLELKVGKNHLTDNQKKMFGVLSAQKYKCVEIRSIEDFLQEVGDYLKTGQKRL
jgi:hypothetical protein